MDEQESRVGTEREMACDRKRKINDELGEDLIAVCSVRRLLANCLCWFDGDGQNTFAVRPSSSSEKMSA